MPWFVGFGEHTQMRRGEKWENERVGIRGMLNRVIKLWGHLGKRWAVCFRFGGIERIFQEDGCVS